MKHSHCCSFERSMPGLAPMLESDNRSATCCRIAAFSVSVTPSSVRTTGTRPSGLTAWKSEPSFSTRLVLGSTSMKLAWLPASYSAILVAIEQARGEKYRSMYESPFRLVLGFRPCVLALGSDSSDD